MMQEIKRLKNNKEALFKLCTVFIEDLKDEIYNPDEIRIENPDFNHLEIKNSSLDIKFDIIDKFSFDLEMQKGKPKYQLEDRMLKYHAELMVRSYPKSEDYRHLICYSLWFIDFKHYKNDDNPIHTLKWDGVNNRAGSITIVEIEKLKNELEKMFPVDTHEEDEEPIVVNQPRGNLLTALRVSSDWIPPPIHLQVLQELRRGIFLEMRLTDGQRMPTAKDLHGGFLKQGQQHFTTENW